MDGCTARKAHSRPGRGSKDIGRAALLALATTGVLAGFSAIPAQAQFLRQWSWHADEGPPPVPPAYVGRGRHRHSPPNPAYETVSLEELYRQTSHLGLHLVAKPRRQGHVFVVFAEDTHGVLHHLAFDAHAGTLIEDGVASAAAKPKPELAPATVAKAAPIPTATAAPAKPAPTTLAAKSAPAAVPSAAPAGANRDLSPIEPQPRSPAKDPNVDKD